LNSHKWDIAVAMWPQLALGLLTVSLSASHTGGALIETLTTYVKGITLNRSASSLMQYRWSSSYRRARLPHSSVSDRALAAHAIKGAGAMMIITINGISVEISR
jgi:hypothetical protein